MLITELNYIAKAFRLHCTGEKKIRYEVKKLEKTNKKHDTLAFITGNIVTGIETLVQKSRKRKSFMRHK